MEITMTRELEKMPRANHDLTSSHHSQSLCAGWYRRCEYKRAYRRIDDLA